MPTGMPCNLSQVIERLENSGDMYQNTQARFSDLMRRKIEKGSIQACNWTKLKTLYGLYCKTVKKIEGNDKSTV